MKEIAIDINDPEHAKAQEIKISTAQMNAEAVVKKLQDFEARLAAQDKLIGDLYAKFLAVQKRLDVQMNLEAMAAKMGNGPTDNGARK
jgi:uncharacterized coiled-coil protein SlyX